MTHSNTETHLRPTTGTNTNRLLELARRALNAEVRLWRKGEGGAFAENCQTVLTRATTLKEPGFLGVPVGASVLYAHAARRSWSVEDVETLELIASLLKDFQESKLETASDYGEEVFQASPDCAKLLSLDGTLLKMNDNGCELMEIDDFSLLAGQPWPSLWPEPEIPASAVAEARAKGEARFQSYCPTAKGTPKWWDVTLKRVPDPNGGGEVLLSVSRDVSAEHKTAEAEEFRDAELRLALSASEMGVWNWDMQSDLVSISAAFQAVWGFSELPDKLLAQDAFARVHPEDLPTMQAAIEKNIQEDVPYNLEFRVQDENGAVRWLTGRGEVIKDETGTPVRMLGVNFDITERHEAKEAAEQQAAILSLAHDPMIVWSEDEGITTWSRGAQDLYGYSEAEVLGQEMHSLLKTQHSESWDTILATMQREGEWRGVLIHTTKAGKKLTVKTRHQLIETRGGQRVLEINHDITEELRLRDREQQLASIIESAPNFVGITDTQGHASYINPAGRKMLNLVSEDVTRMSIMDFHSPKTVQSHQNVALPSAVQNGSWTGESELKTLEGALVPVLQTIVAHKDVGGSSYFSTIATDISRRLQVEAQLNTLNQDLEARVAERTAALKRSNAELDQFTYIASHDLKAPLRAIDNLASWIFEDAAEQLPAPSLKHLSTLQGRVKRMEKLLEDLLMFSRVDRQSHRAETVALRDLMTNVARLAGVPDSFSLEVTYGVDKVTTARTSLETVLRNLLSNAVKHHPREDGRVQVIFADEGERLSVAVSDDGDGIHPDFHERIFGIFQTLKSRDELEASGIGLAVVKKILERRGGSITLESEPSNSQSGAGATFRVSWPKYAEEDDL